MCWEGRICRLASPKVTDWIRIIVLQKLVMQVLRLAVIEGPRLRWILAITRKQQAMGREMMLLLTGQSSKSC
ncbi:hypothetical protein NY98_21765 [Xanthomonas citri pv. fuscans]|uniref:Transposase n=2 Tax=Xanthomonas citri TaxID=346 RepID=A0AB34Q0Z7_XANCI|nr:hypothetical protein AC613_14010 [Xanthomonas citri pv. fuscans]KGP22610.1 hypothetical protein NY65_19310 [Xanthomonas phaseoli pv. phaseoli]AZU22154.1 hypothetical protein AC612_14020 [Xanthomonas citri pv. fuscans]AZU93402.1 hypothetical protein AC614_14015 [Xanthomonas citri pv. fuscans]KGP21488.1 hypothetical protein NY67_21465 [Xanthomonas citri pv. fuscans]